MQSPLSAAEVLERTALDGRARVETSRHGLQQLDRRDRLASQWHPPTFELREDEQVVGETT
jgi:hypothetical protein